MVVPLTDRPLATLTRENVLLWLAGPAIASIAVAISGLLVGRQKKRMGLVLFVVGFVGLFASAAWIALALWVEAVVR